MSSNVVILGKAGTNETYIPFSLNDGGVLYTDQAPNSNAGIIQGRDLNQGGVDFGVVLDGMGTNLNALPTCSRLYATNTTSGAIEPVGINDAGELVVSGGGGGGGGAVQISDSNGDPLLGTDSALNVNIQGVAKPTVGTITGLAAYLINETLNSSVYAYDLVGNEDVKINADVNGATNINRLYTHSNLYANNDTNEETPVKCDIDGNLNVNIVSGGGGTVFIQDSVGGQLLGTDSALNINVQGVNLIDVGGVVGLSTNINNSFLDTHCYGSSDGTVFHHLKTTAQGNLITESKTHDGSNQPIASTDYSGDRALNVSVANASINTVVDNNIIVSPIVQKQNFDVVLNDDLYADSTGNNDPPFQRDPRGHQGWYYLNTDPLKSSNVYYYFNIPALPLTRQDDILLTDINCFYAVITIDYVGTSANNLPFLVMGSQPTGVNDHIPNFANTVYAYTLPTGNTYIAGEPIVIYWSDSVDKKPLDTFMPNLRRVKCNNPTISGTGEGTKLGYFSVNTPTGVVEKQEYTLIGAGYKINNTGGEQGGVINTSTFDFLFTAQTVIENNLAKLTFNETNELLVFNSNTQTSSGAFGNIASDTTLATGADTSVFSLTDGNYKKDCILTVKDTSITSTGYYSISVSSGGSYETLGIVQPLTLLNGTRGGSTILNLSPYNNIKLTNESGGSYANVYISLYSS